MKKFLIHIVCFGLPILLLAYPADLLLGKYLKKSHPNADEYMIWNAIYDGKINAEIVIYGSSTAWVQVNSLAIADSLHRSVYNLGMDGHNFWMQYLRHKSLLEHNKAPHLIIQTLDIFTLQKRPNLYNPDQFLPYMLFNNDLKTTTAGYEGYKSVDFQLPLVRYYGKRKAISTAVRLSMEPGSDAPNRVFGFQAQNTPWNDDFNKAKMKMKNYEATLDSATIRLFDRYLQECRARKIEMVFLYAPEYIEGQQFISNRDAVVALYEAFGKKYDIPFYNYSDDSLTRDRNNFFNNLHLNQRGSKLLTNKLIHDLKFNSRF